MLCLHTPISNLQNELVPLNTVIVYIDPMLELSVSCFLIWHLASMDPSISVIFVMLVSCFETDTYLSTTIFWNQTQIDYNYLYNTMYTV